MAANYTHDQLINKQVNILMLENKWPDMATAEITAFIVKGLAPNLERLALLDGEVVSAYVVSRSKGEPA